MLDVHANTVRLYEAWGFIASVPRAANGYRAYSSLHVEQAKLVRLALEWPTVGDRNHLRALVINATSGDLGMAMEQAYQYLALIRSERTFAEAAVEFLERWAAGYLMDSPRREMHIGQAAQYLNVTVDMLRNWERNGLIDVPRDPSNGYRLYGTTELGRLRVIRVLVKSGYSLMAILRMLREFDAGRRENLGDALAIPHDEGDLQDVEIIADRWLSSLVALEQRAQAIIQQIGHLIQMAHTADA